MPLMCRPPDEGGARDEGDGRLDRLDPEPGLVRLVGPPAAGQLATASLVKPVDPPVTPAGHVVAELRVIAEVVEQPVVDGTQATEPRGARPMEAVGQRLQKLVKGRFTIARD